jgi:septal ring factor EnvC (AmiA/AmiB activator)
MTDALQIIKEQNGIIKTTERELAAVTEQLKEARDELKRTDFALSQASIIYDVVVEQRDRLAKAVGSAILALTVASLMHDQDRGTTDFFKGEISELDKALQSLKQPQT